MIPEIVLPIIVGGMTVAYVYLLGKVHDSGFKSGRHFENYHITRVLKEHRALDGFWHQLLGQYRQDIDCVIINSTITRPRGFSVYLYTALHEYYHSQFHKDVPTVLTKEENIKYEKEANDFAMKVIPTIISDMLLLGLIEKEDARVPEIVEIDGIPSVSDKTIKTEAKTNEA